MTTLLHKQPGEVRPIDFDFTKHLGGLAVNTTINSVVDITASPTGDANDLDLGTSLDWAIEGLRVQTLARKGRDGVLYDVECRVAAVTDDGSGTRAHEPHLHGVVLVEERGVP